MPEVDWARKVPPSSEIAAPFSVLAPPSLLANRMPLCTETLVPAQSPVGAERSSIARIPVPCLLMRVMLPPPLPTTPVCTNTELLKVTVPEAVELVKQAGPEPLTFNYELLPVVL